MGRQTTHNQQQQYRDGYMSAMSEVRELLARQYGMPELGNRLTTHLHNSVLHRTADSLTITPPLQSSRISTPSAANIPPFAPTTMFTPRVLFSPTQTIPSSTGSASLSTSGRLTNFSSSTHHLFKARHILKSTDKHRLSVLPYAKPFLSHQVENIATLHNVHHNDTADTDSAVHSASDDSVRLQTSDSDQQASSSLSTSHEHSAEEMNLDESALPVWRPF